MSGEGSAAHPRLHKAGEVVVDEFRRFLVMFVYLWLLFGVLALHEDIVLREHGIGYIFHGVALVNAAVLGKVMLIAEDLRVGERFRERPLIYPIVIESLMLSILFILVHILEHVIGGMIAGETLRASIPAIGGGGVQGLLCVGLILFVALLPFFAFRRITKEVGTARIKAMLFGEPAT